MNEDGYAPTASAAGILLCLRLLAQEAASLRLVRTVSAIEDAVHMAATERVPELGADEPARAARLLVH